PSPGRLAPLPLSRDAFATCSDRRYAALRPRLHGRHGPDVRSGPGGTPAVGLAVRTEIGRARRVALHPPLDARAAAQTGLARLPVDPVRAGPGTSRAARNDVQVLPHLPARGRDDAVEDVVGEAGHARERAEPAQ